MVSGLNKKIYVFLSFLLLIPKILPLMKESIVIL